MSQSIQDKITAFFSTHPEKTYPKGTIVTLAGDDPAGVYLLVSGLVEQYDITPEGNRSTVNIFKPRAFFPMSWAINKTPNTYFYAAQTDVTLRVASAEATVAFLQSEPDVLFDLLSRVYKGTDALLRHLVVATSGLATQRVIFELLIEAYRFGKQVDDVTRRIKVKQSDLAARSGLARETVSRELHKLQQNKLVTPTKAGLLLNITQLEQALSNT